VLAHLIEAAYQGNLEAAVQKALTQVQGTYGIAVIHTEHPSQIIVARRGSPIVLGIGKTESLAASDVSALAQHTDQVVYLEDNEVARLEPGQFSISTLDNKSVSRPVTALEIGPEALDRGNFPHFMLKEIFEQPEAVENALRGRLNHSEAVAKLGGLESVEERLAQARHLIIISCGTSYYAGLYARYVFESLTDLTVETELASEFATASSTCGRTPWCSPSASRARRRTRWPLLREAKRKGALVLGLVNVVGSSIARETHAGVYSHAGVEVGVASTKSFTLAAHHPDLDGAAARPQPRPFLRGGVVHHPRPRKVPDQMRHILEQSDRIRDLARKYSNARISSISEESTSTPSLSRAP